MAEDRFSIVDSVRDYIRFAVDVTSSKRVTLDPLDLWAFASISIVLAKVALEFPHGHRGSSTIYLVAAVVPQLLGMLSIFVGWLVFAVYAHVCARLIGGQAEFTATFRAVIAVLTASYAMVSLGSLGYGLVVSALGNPHTTVGLPVSTIFFVSLMIMLVWLFPGRLGTTHALSGGQRAMLALVPIVPVVAVGLLFFGSILYLVRLLGL
jgi:hypothetical protein